MKYIWVWILTVIFLAVPAAGVSASEGEPKHEMTIRDCLDISFERNLGLKSAKEEVTAREYERRAAVAEFLFKGTTTYTYTRLNEPPSMRLSSIPGGRTDAGDQNLFAWSTTAVQPIFKGFATYSNYQLAKLGLNVAEVRRIQARIDLAFQVKAAYYAVLNAEKLKGVEEQAVKTLEAHLRVAQNFYEAGMSPKIDVLNAEVELADARQGLITAENNLSVARSRLNNLLRRGMDDPIVLLDRLEIMPYRVSYDECVATALKKRPELKEGGLNIEIARKTIILARSGFYPHLSLQSTYTRQGDNPDLGGSEFLDQEEWSMMVKAEWNFWEWGRNYYAVRAAKRRLKEAENTLEELKDAAKLRVKEAYLGLDEAEKKVKVAEKTVEQAVENLRMSEERYAQHVATSTEVLDAQTLLTKARTNYFTSLTQHNDAKARLLNSMGLEGL